MRRHKFSYITRQLSFWQRVAFSFILFMLIYFNAFTAVPQEVSFALKEVRNKINNDLTSINNRLANVSKEFSATGINTYEARRILRRFLRFEGLQINCATVDLSGKIALIEPRLYRRFEGADISKQGHVIELLQSRKPVFSKLFLSVEGPQAISFAYPVFSSKGEFIGFVSLLIKPDSMIEPAIISTIKRSRVEIWVMQPDGVTVYDQDTQEIGKNVFKDDLYKPFPDFISLCKIIAQEKSGSGSYEFLAPGLKEKVIKDVSWDTVSINGLEWRIVAALARQQGYGQ